MEKSYESNRSRSSNSYPQTSLLLPKCHTYREREIICWEKTFQTRVFRCISYGIIKFLGFLIKFLNSIKIFSWKNIFRWVAQAKVASNLVKWWGKGEMLASFSFYFQGSFASKTRLWKLPKRWLWMEGVRWVKRLI